MTSIKTVGNVVSSPSRLVHSPDVGQVFNVLKVTSHTLVQPVESSVVNELSHDLQSLLIPPLIHLRHVYVVYEYCH